MAVDTLRAESYPRGAAGRRRRTRLPAVADRQLTVLHVLEAVGGGTARHLVDVVRHTPGVRHVIAMPPRRVGHLSDDRAVAKLTAAGAEVRLVEMRRLPVHWRNLGGFARLIKLVHELQPDIIHGHAAVGGALARMLPGSAVRVYTPHAIYPQRPVVAVERLLARRTQHLVAVSDSEGRFAVERGIADESSVVVIPNGVSLSAPEPVDLHAMLGLQRDVPLVGTIARLVAQKAPDAIVAAFRRAAELHPTAHFVVIGDGHLAPVIDNAGEGALAGRIHRIPSLPDAETVLPSLSVFALLSAFEGGPYSPLQAARASVPLVLSDVVGNSDIIEPGVSGELVPFADAEAAARAIVSLLDDPKRAELLAGAMMLRLVERFNVEAMGASYVRFYLTAGRRSQVPAWVRAGYAAAPPQAEGISAPTANT
ncbi:MAG TPA: glycosyltransferase [Mycobacteriales bacterium]|nr:glycosyltransferase [Mycobacteriales bacterium]